MTLAVMIATRSRRRSPIRSFRDRELEELDGVARVLLRLEPIQARQILRKLVNGRLVFTPGEDAAGRCTSS